MNRKEFLAYLRRKLWRYPKEEVNEAVAYYDELISDKMSREGISEYRAVESFGDKKKIVRECESVMKAKVSGGSVIGGLFVGVFASPLVFALAVCALVLIIVVGAVWFSLIAAFGAVAVAGIAAAVGNWFFYTDISSALIATGTGLILFVAGCGLCYVLVKYGGRVVSAAVRGIANSVSKRKGGNK